MLKVEKYVVKYSCRSVTFANYVRSPICSLSLLPYLHFHLSFQVSTLVFQRILVVLILFILYIKNTNCVLLNCVCSLDILS